MPMLPSGTVTFVFTDIEASTRLLRQLGDRYEDVLSHYRRLLRASVQANRGLEVDTQGDAFFAVFDSARGAVVAAVAAQRALAAHEWPGGSRPRVRIGLHTGEPSLWEEGYLGLAVHRAARICSAAQGDQIVLSNATRAVLKEDEQALPDVTFRDLGDHELKDMGAPERLHQVVVQDLPKDLRAPRSVDSQAVNAMPFAGQEEELAAAARVALGTVGTRPVSGPRRVGSARAGDLTRSLRVLFEAVWESTRSPLGLATLGILLVGAILFEPWIALGIPVYYVLAIPAAIHRARYSHGPEGVAHEVRLLAKIPRDEGLQSELKALTVALFRGSRSAESAARYLARIDRGELTDRLRRLRGEYVSEDQLRSADLIAAHLAVIREVDEARLTLTRETAALQSRLNAWREELFRTRMAGEVPEELSSEVSAVSSRIRALVSSLDDSYRRVKAF